MTVSRDRMRGSKLYQDQLYGAKILSPLAVAIVDTPEFQRLAGLRQLGFADKCYRGARHTRFEHSIGTYFVCRTLLRKISQNHERLELNHPGLFASRQFRHVGSSDLLPDGTTTPQSRWRGVTEAVSIAALLHDIGHVPFGHTFEDEFSGLFARHDALAGPRLYEMLFNEASDLARVFSQREQQWVGDLQNSELAKLIYLILSWSEETDSSSPMGFSQVLEKEIQGEPNQRTGRLRRLTKLQTWHRDFSSPAGGDQPIFLPFMADVVGNTICADLFDYLARDRRNCGMEYRLHTRLHRFLTIRQGTHYEGEGLRVSIMVSQAGHGSQRRDVASDVLALMRDRYELVERVLYHHKKCAASAMLARLLEMMPREQWPKNSDEDPIYPAPWTDRPLQDSAISPLAAEREVTAPHFSHFTSDEDLIRYLTESSRLSVSTATGSNAYRRQEVQKALAEGLGIKRKQIYRTLLVVDSDLLDDGSVHGPEYIADYLRNDPNKNPGRSRRNALESLLTESAGVEEGEILLYCPSAGMQAKEVEARVELHSGKVIPLRNQKDFVYREDLNGLASYYERLWRMYVFVSAAVFAESGKCKVIVDKFCDHFVIGRNSAYSRVRRHSFVSDATDLSERRLVTLRNFFSELSIKDLPPAIVASFLEAVRNDSDVANILAAGASPLVQYGRLFAATGLSMVSELSAKSKPGATRRTRLLEEAREAVLSGRKDLRLAAWSIAGSPSVPFAAWVEDLRTIVSED